MGGYGDSSLSGAGEGTFPETLSDDSLLEYISQLSQVPKQRDNEYSRGDYFHDKARQQLHQDEVFRTRNGSSSTIFAGCSIYINGFTRPGRMQLHDLIVVHGGRFVHYLSAKGKVTHIVASNLPLKKRIELRNYRVCRPEWIVESVGARRLLPWQNYSLLQDHDQDQACLPRGGDGVVDCKHPQFLEQFFSHSRLHHLSLWKAELRAYFLQKFIENPSRPLVTPRRDEQFTVFHVDFDCFFASVAALCTRGAVNVELDPIIVCHGDKTSDIASCNYVARKYGVRNGMWVRRAERLVPAGVKLVRLPYDFEQFEAKSRAFYQVLHELDFSLVVPVSIDEAVCVATTPPLGASECDALCQRIRSLVRLRTCCTVSVGCADSLVLARLALKRAKPDGYHVVMQSQLDRQFLAGFQPGDLPGVGPSLVDKLGHDADLDLAQLQDWSLESLQRRAGQKLGNKIYLALRGRDDDESAKMVYDPRSVFRRKTLSVDVNWGIRFDTIHEIDLFIDRCTQYLTGKLVSLGKTTSQVTLRVMRRCKDEAVEPAKYLGMGRCDAFSRTARLGVATTETGVIATEMKITFRGLACPPRDLRGVSIQFKLEEPGPLREGRLTLPLGVCENRPKVVVCENRRTGHVAATRANSYQERFMQELPTQIRHEVQRDIRITSKAQRTKLAEIQQQITRRKQRDKNHKAHFQADCSLFEPIAFQGETSFKTITRMVLDWVDGTIPVGGPHERDVHLFDKYLNRLSDANRLPLMLRIAKLLATRLDLRSARYGSENGFQEWEKVLLTTVLPKLNKNKHTFQTVRRLDIDFEM